MLNDLKSKKYFFSFMIISILIIISCSNHKDNKLIISEFGKLDNNKTVFKYTLSNSNKVSFSVINYGAIITNLYVSDSNGETIDVVLGFDNLENYVQGHPYFGSVVGRFGNRIENGEFMLNDLKYSLALNNDTNSLHGGLKGFDKVYWEYVESSNPLNTIKFRYLSKDMEEGFPGNLEVFISYTLTEKNEIIVAYEAVTDKSTIINLTQHSYFNLSGESSGKILDHKLSIDADYFLPVKKNMIPSGELRLVKETPFDFSISKEIGLEINSKNNQIQIGNGYDHCWVLNNFDGSVRKVADAKSNSSGIQMEVYSDQPGIQLYTGNFLDGSIVSKKKNKYEKNSGFCLETQHFPNSPNEDNFPTVVLNPGEKYDTTTVFKFIL